ncbi:MAG: hypothetical protein ACTTH5_00920 [Wolinella sp.]
MQHRPLIVLLTFLTIGVAVVIFSAYLKTLQEVSSLSFSKIITEDSPAQEREHTSSWMSRFSAREIPSYIYPTPELHVSLSFPTAPLGLLKTFHVIIGKVSAYQFFCLKQVLLAHKINYSYHKEGGRVQLIITTQDEEYLRSVLKELSRYEITYQIHKS